ncbi:MAG: class I SAM-dependent methyltransferase [Thermoleophilia bacterium]
MSTSRTPAATGASPAPGPAAARAASVPAAPCRACGAPLVTTVVDLGMSPPCESFLAADELNRMEPFYPLHLEVCDRCFLVQLQSYIDRNEIFREYAYFSSYSDSWVAHARAYVDAMVERLGLGPDSLVVELASNDGYLLQHVVERGVPALGVEPALNVAQAAIDRGVPTVTEFFGVELARRLAAEHGHADLIAGNNVLAQVPDLHDFVGGIAVLLADDGVLTLEFPHLQRLLEGRQFDTIYHEHFSYFSFLTVTEILAGHGLAVFDVEELPTHGGSLRVFARKAGPRAAPTAAASELWERERLLGYRTLEPYAAFGAAVEETKRDLLSYLIEARRAGRVVAGYGAPGKGNTLLNYCGIRTDLLSFTVDRNPYKHGRFTPGTHIPIFPVERIAEEKPDDILILPWNLRDEIVAQLDYVRAWGGRCVVPIPTVEVVLR